MIALSSLPNHDAPPNVAPALRLALFGAARADGLSPGQRRLAVGTIVAAHVAGVWGLMQVGEVREAAREVMPMFVDLIAPSAPPTPPKLAAPIPPTPRPVPKRPPPPAPLIAAAPSPAPAAFMAPPPEEAPATTPAPSAAVVVAAPAPPPPASAPAPRTIAPSGVQYLVEPAPEYPRLSTRNRETGRVLVLVFINEAGMPGQVQVARSSGFTRLDDAAMAAVAKSRFRPPTINGQPVSGWTNVPIDFTLDK